MNGPKIPSNPSQESDNKNKIEELESIFTNADEVTEEFLLFVNSELDKKDLEKLVFSVVKVNSKSFVYINENLELVLCDFSESSLNNVLNAVKVFSEKRTDIDTLKIRDLLLIFGKGILKSYDVYSKIVTTNLTKREIKSLIRSNNFWIESRKAFQDNLVQECLARTISLSEKIQKSENVAIYCVRGSIASGKSTYIANFIKGFVDPDADSSGVISTDNIKNNLIEKTENLSGVPLIGYSFHDEASMLSEIILDEVISSKVPFIVDKRMQEENDLPNLLSKLDNTGLPVVIFDIKTDFFTSALRALKRTGTYPSNPVPDFNSFVKTYQQIEENRGVFVQQSMDSDLVKHHIEVTSTNKSDLRFLKRNYSVQPDAYIPTNPAISENFQGILLSDGQTLSKVMDEHCENVFKPTFSKEYYSSRISENINLTSRSAKGEINTSASPDKKLKVKSDLTREETTSKVKSNLASTIEYIYSNKNLMLSSPETLKDFIDEIAFKVNDGIIVDRKHLFREGDNSDKYNYVDTKNVKAFYNKFISELYSKILDIKSDKVELAAWVEWNIDFCGHFFSDGCGRIAKLVSMWVLARNDLSLPNYLLGQDGFDTVRESYRKRFSIRTKVNYTEPVSDKNYTEFLKYYRRLFVKTERKEQILGAGGLIYNSQGQFLVLQTSKGKDRGKWVIPGGKMEAGELPLETFKREIREETGLEVQEILPLGNRDYTALSGNQYHFYEYKAVASNEDGIKINDESLSYKWISESEVADLPFTDSSRNFINRYFKESPKSYYQQKTKLDESDLDIPHFAEHTMYKNLGKYVESKLPIKDLQEFLPLVKRIEVHGIFPDLTLISELDLDFKIVKVISESSTKEDNSNSVRPIFVLAERDGEQFIVCFAIPGRDHLVHYGSMIGFYLKDSDIQLSVYAYPDAENKINKLTGLDETLVHQDDTVVLGYSTYFKELFLQNNYTQISSTQNSFYKSTRFKSPNGKIINCLESSYGPWGDIGGFIAEKVCQLGAEEIIHIGKVGTLSSPSEVYERIYIPKSFVVARRDEVFFAGASVENSMEYIEEHASDAHASIATTMEETLSQRQNLEDAKVDTIDMESSKIAQSIALFNQRSDKKVKYGAIHFASDYLKKDGEIEQTLDFDLTSERKEIKSKKYKILNEIFTIMQTHIKKTI